MMTVAVNDIAKLDIDVSPLGGKSFKRGHQGKVVYIHDAEIEFLPDGESEHITIPKSFVSVVKSTQATAQPADTRPTTITAREFVDEGYAELVEAGKCVVKWGINIVEGCEHSGAVYTCAIRYADKDQWGFKYAYPETQFTVEWLLAPAQAAQADSGAGDKIPDPLDLDGVEYAIAGIGAILMEEFHSNHPIWHHLKAIDEAWQEQRDDNTALRSQLEAAQAEIGRLSEALEYYANPKLYLAKITTYNTGDYDVDCELIYEGGKIAREALSKAASKEET